MNLELELLEYLRSNGFDFAPFHVIQDEKPPYFVYECDRENLDGIDGKTHTKEYSFFLYVYTKTYKQSVELEHRLEEVLYSFKKQVLNYKADSDFEEDLYMQKIFFQMIL